MFRDLKLFVLVMVLLGFAANAQGQTAATKYDAWELGANLGMAAILNAVGDTQPKIDSAFNLAVQNGDKFGIKLPELPAKTKVQTEYTRRLLDYFIEKAGHPTQKYLKANFSEEHAAAFDIGLVTNIYFFLQFYGDSVQTELYSPIFLFMIEDRTSIANLPFKTTEELIKLDGKKPSKEIVKKAVFSTITNVSQYFMKRDETEIGDSLAAKEKYDEAIIQYSGVIKFDADFAEAYFKRGLAYQKIGKEDLAKLDFEKAESLVPGIVKKLNAAIEVKKN